MMMMLDSNFRPEYDSGQGFTTLATATGYVRQPVFFVLSHPKNYGVGSGGISNTPGRFVTV